MGQGGFKKLEEEIRKYSDLRLVVIDTLKMFRPAETSNRRIYDQDYEPIAKIKSIADQHNVSILIIHHLRKSDAQDVMDTFSGSLGLTGATDTNLVLSRVTGNADAILHINGRDVEATEFALVFDPWLLSWNIVGHAEDVKSTVSRQSIYDALKKAKKPLTRNDIVTATGLKANYISKALPDLMAEGNIKKEGRGLYVYREI